MEGTMQEIAKKLVEEPKGILAADESISTANERLESVGIEPVVENRRLYRELFLDVDGIEKYLSGVILCEETVDQHADNGENFVDLLISKGIVPGVKVDKSITPMPNFPGEVITQGLDGLRERLKDFRAKGLRFAKWRTVTKIGENLPTYESIQANALGLALYAAYCQEADIVPIVEPEVLLDGDHDIVKAEEVTTGVLTELFKMLKSYKVDLSATILKTSMVVPGGDYKESVSHEEIAKATTRTLLNSVPEEVAGVVFLSGGQTPDDATYNLNEIAKYDNLPWPVTFSFARAIQHDALAAWHGVKENMPKAREIFLKRLELESKARMGEL